MRKEAVYITENLECSEKFLSELYQARVLSDCNMEELSVCAECRINFKILVSFDQTLVIIDANENFTEKSKRVPNEAFEKGPECLSRFYSSTGCFRSSINQKNYKILPTTLNLVYFSSGLHGREARTNVGEKIYTRTIREVE